MNPTWGKSSSPTTSQAGFHPAAANNLALGAGTCRTSGRQRGWPAAGLVPG